MLHDGGVVYGSEVGGVDEDEARALSDGEVVLVALAQLCDRNVSGAVPAVSLVRAGPAGYPGEHSLPVCVAIQLQDTGVVALPHAVDPWALVPALEVGLDYD